MAARRRSPCASRWRPRAFARTAAYDAAIATWFAARLGEPTPTTRVIAGRLRRGAALWREPASIGGVLPHAASSASASPPRRRCRARSSPTTISTTPTRPMSWSPSSTPRRARPSPSSSTPIRAAWRSAQVLAEAYAKALACDPVSAFGGIVALNRPLDADAAREIVKIFTEVIIAPGRERRGQSHSRREEESAAAAGRRAARPEGCRASPSARSPAAFSCSRATTA